MDKVDDWYMKGRGDIRNQEASPPTQPAGPAAQAERWFEHSGAARPQRSYFVLGVLKMSDGEGAGVMKMKC